ncbi:MAG: nicotinate phosphoribosyltransferase [Gemmatimonadaceae bacterium]|nr:nicotinate phosphoribosyltransferase [Gemmatimonadaceae bacterium]
MPAAPPGFEPSPATLAGQTADVYFLRSRQVLEAEGRDPAAVIEVFARRRALLCGMREVEALLSQALAGAAAASVERLPEGRWFDPGEVVLRVSGPYRAFGLYETALLGALASETGWATAASACVAEAGGVPVVHFGARHVHPDVSPRLEYAAVVGGCSGCATPAGAALSGLEATGTLPHALVLIFGDTLEAALAFDRQIDPAVGRTVLVDTFLDEAEESVRVAGAMGERLWAVRLDTPSELGGVTPELVGRVRSRLDAGGHRDVKILVSGGITPERIRAFREAGAAVDGYGVGSAISGAPAVDFTADVKEVDGVAVAKRGRRPGRTDNPRLEVLELTS